MAPSSAGARKRRPPPHRRASRIGFRAGPTFGAARLRSRRRDARGSEAGSSAAGAPSGCEPRALDWPAGSCLTAWCGGRVPTTDGSMTPAARYSLEGLDARWPTTEALPGHSWTGPEPPTFLLISLAGGGDGRSPRRRGRSGSLALAGALSRGARAQEAPDLGAALPARLDGPGRAQEPAAHGGPPGAAGSRPAAALHRQP